MTLVDTEQTVSHGVWSTVRGAYQDWYLEIKDENGDPVEDEHELTQQLMSVIQSNNPDDKNYSRFSYTIDFESLRSQAYKFSKVRGGVCGEAVVDNFRNPKYIRLIDPVHVEFKETSPFRYRPYQKNVVTGGSVGGSTEKSLDKQNFFWVRLDPSSEDPYMRSPIYPILETVYFFREFIRDLKEVVNKTAWPRISVSLLEQVMATCMPTELQNASNEKIEEWKTKQKAAIAQTVQDLRPGDVFVHSDYIGFDMIESKGQQKGTLNPEPLLKVLERHLAQSMKTFASVLGVNETVDPLQQHAEGQSIKGFQQPVEVLFSQMFTFFFRCMGRKVSVVFKHVPFELRPKHELEPARAQKVATNIQLLKLGAMTPHQFCIESTGKPMPKGSKLHEVYNKPELYVERPGEVPQPSESDDPGSPGKSVDPTDGRSDPAASVKRGKQPKAKKTGEIKKTPDGKNRKPKKK